MNGSGKTALQLKTKDTGLKNYSFLFEYLRKILHFEPYPMSVIVYQVAM